VPGSKPQHASALSNENPFDQGVLLSRGRWLSNARRCSCRAHGYLIYWHEFIRHRRPPRLRPRTAVSHRFIPFCCRPRSSAAPHNSSALRERSPVIAVAGLCRSRRITGTEVLAGYRGTIRRRQQTTSVRFPAVQADTHRHRWRGPRGREAFMPSPSSPAQSRLLRSWPLGTSQPSSRRF
jgi:hypothetical protein